MAAESARTTLFDGSHESAQEDVDLFRTHPDLTGKSIALMTFKEFQELVFLPNITLRCVKLAEEAMTSPTVSLQCKRRLCAFATSLLTFYAPADELRTVARYCYNDTLFMLAMGTREGASAASNGDKFDVKSVPVFEAGWDPILKSLWAALK